MSRCRPAVYSPGRLKDFIMGDSQLLLAQTFIDIIAWFIVPFAIVLACTWVVSLFRRP